MIGVTVTKKRQKKNSIMFQGPLRIPFIRKRNVKLILTSVFPMSISSSQVAE